ncbi:cytotoxic granule associated RNA binding protein TIA1-like, partial [Eupeodes corollae]|uniref:cytotoxic granule associated RNA binding protein TIA1-like n=1 Tax=Eupeodes corollae TaxID=290404 RepID=UPI002490FD4C
FSTKEAATHAIVAVHNSEINSQPVKCAWGKESGDPNNVPSIASQALSQAGFPFGTAAAAAAYGQQVAGYWYPSAPTYPAAAPAPTNALQAGQFLQGMQGYAYSQFAGYQQGYMGMGVQIPGAWQSVPPQAQIPGATAPQIAQGVGSALPQATGVVAYPMQQFQVSPQVSCILYSIEKYLYICILSLLLLLLFLNECESFHRLQEVQQINKNKDYKSRSFFCQGVYHFVPYS